MTTKRRIRPRIGDIIEIRTPKGYAYAQYTHEHSGTPKMGSLIRVLPGIFASRPGEFSHIVQDQELFSVFFPLGPAVARGITVIVGNTGIPDHLAPFPLFKSGIEDPLTGKVAQWWLWDGEREWPMPELRPEHRNLPMLEIINDTLLIDRIVSYWRPHEEIE